MRTIMIGDIHGTLDELMLLLVKAGYCPGDRVISLGDLCDRGIDSPGVIKYCIEKGFEAVMGNHDAKLVKRWRHVVRKRHEPSYKISMRYSADQMQTITALSDSDMEWLANLPHYISLQEFNVLCVHAGLMPRLRLEHQPKEVLTMLRYLDIETRRKMLSMKYPDFEQPDNSIFWAECYDGKADVVFGHSVVSLDGTIGYWEGLGRGRCYGIDTGAVFGGYLSAMILDSTKPESREIVQVKALREYYEPAVKYKTL